MHMHAHPNCMHAIPKHKAQSSAVRFGVLVLYVPAGDLRHPAGAVPSRARGPALCMCGELPFGLPPAGTLAGPPPKWPAARPGRGLIAEEPSSNGKLTDA